MSIILPADLMAENAVVSRLHHVMREAEQLWLDATSAYEAKRQSYVKACLDAERNSKADHCTVYVLRVTQPTPGTSIFYTVSDWFDSAVVATYYDGMLQER